MENFVIVYNTDSIGLYDFMMKLGGNEIIPDDFQSVKFTVSIKKNHLYASSLFFYI